jgi:hypothetical protein
VSTRFTLTLRRGPQVERERFGSLEDALAALEQRIGDVAREARREPVTVLGRRLDPVQQVAARGELSGPGRLRLGVDVRGDGSTEPWIGRWRRRIVEQQPRETAYAALRRVLGTS